MPRAKDIPQVEDGFTRIANALLEAILAFGFTQRELLVLLAILRKTYGYGKKADDMSASQISAMCRVPRQHVATTLVNLALRNIIFKSPGQYGSIIGIQKDHRKWISADIAKRSLASPESGQVDDEGEKSGFSVPDDTSSAMEPAPELDSASPESGQGCPDTGHVPIWVLTCPESGQVASPKSGHTKENLPKENKQKNMSGRPDAAEVLKHLNEKTGRNYEPVKANLDLIAARLQEASVETCKAVIDAKVAEWGNDTAMRKYLRPKTIFNATNFANYKGELPPASSAASTAQIAPEAWRKDPRFARGQ